MQIVHTSSFSRRCRLKTEMCHPRSATALVTALLLTAARATGPRCKSQTNTNVDWWVIYKLPVLTDAPTGTAWRDGYGYAYMDSQNPGDGLVAPPPAKNSSLQDKSMALTNTLAQVIIKISCLFQSPRSRALKPHRRSFARAI